MTFLFPLRLFFGFFVVRILIGKLQPTKCDFPKIKFGLCIEKECQVSEKKGGQVNAFDLKVSSCSEGHGSLSSILKFRNSRP